MKPEVIALVKFLLLTLFGGIVGFSAALTVQAFLTFALLTVIIQILLGIGMDHYRRVKHEQYLYEQRLEENAILAANSVEIHCAACQTPHSIPIIINQRNLFRCRKCEVENVIIVSAETALTTEPLTTKPIE